MSGIATVAVQAVLVSAAFAGSLAVALGWGHGGGR